MIHIYGYLSDDMANLIVDNIDKYYHLIDGEFIHIINEDIIVLYKHNVHKKQYGDWYEVSRKISTKELMRQIKLDSVL